MEEDFLEDSRSVVEPTAMCILDDGVGLEQGGCTMALGLLDCEVKRFAWVPKVNNCFLANENKSNIPFGSLHMKIQDPVLYVCGFHWTVALPFLVSCRREMLKRA